MDERFNNKENTRPRAVIAALDTERDEEAFEHSLRELDALADAAGIEVVDAVTQRAEQPSIATWLGSGKIEELKGTVFAAKADLVLFDCTLSPTQLRNLDRLLECEIIDRTDLILRIFDERARTKEARMQVEYARLEYLLPRLVGMRSNLSRQGGGSGFRSARGAGETQLELDRRRIEKRMAALRRELKEIKKEREVQRERRLSSGLARVSLVGYTNAGKSTLLNRLIDYAGAGEDKRVFEEDMLFATLDTTVRRIDLQGRTPFLLSDTVGFVSDLPHALVEAFHSTLEEAALADLLLMVIDYSDEDYPRQIEVTERTLAQIGAGHVPVIRVYNKIDLVPGAVMHTDGRGSSVYLSAAAGGTEALEAILDLVTKTLEGVSSIYSFTFSYRELGALEALRQCAEVLETDYREEAVFVRAVCGKRTAQRFGGVDTGESLT